MVDATQQRCDTAPTSAARTNRIAHPVSGWVAVPLVFINAVAKLALATTRNAKLALATTRNAKLALATTRNAKLALAFGVVVSIAACGGGRAKPPPPVRVVPPAPPVSERRTPPPEWVTSVPQPQGQVCATGGVDPTYYRQDGRRFAAEAARNELARSIEVHITSVMVDVETSRGGSVNQYIVSEVVSFVEDGVVRGAEVLSYWYDAVGSLSRRGMTYALACIRTDQSLEQLTESLKAAYPEAQDQAKVEAIRERAENLFDELEQMEVKKKASGE